MYTIQPQVSLQPFNTFGIQAIAQYFVTITSIGDVQQLIKTPLFGKERHLILGGGSNLLLTQDFNGLIIKNEIKGIEILKEIDDTITLKVGAGENWHTFVLHCVNQDWGGVENLSLIPGTVGAAPMQNIGAYGVEIKDIIDSVEVVNLQDGTVSNFTNYACNFGYRESIFKQSHRDKYLISSITLTLTKKNHRFNASYGSIMDVLRDKGIAEPSVKAISDAVVQIRRSKLPDPAHIGNAGSFFKNPSINTETLEHLKLDYPNIPSFPGEKGLKKISAAWLIEQCGWKGKTFNNIGVHQHQALVLVNYGGGSGKNIWQLAMDIQASVKEKFNIILQPEVNVI
ncbi:MAG: UDP-N-acetylmuramate dehydrogenase [Cyclobacteriaceae bacterium]|nr:UDP-N-acetylmuramate dehydrogenase [Cyclobacteriaceae bacterium]